MQNKIIENLEKIEVIVAANFAREHPEVALEVRRLAQDAMREVRSLLTLAAPDVCAFGHSEKEHSFFDDHSECDVCQCENGFTPVS